MKKAHINTDYLSQCLAVLEEAHNQMGKQTPDDILYNVYRSACIKEFEIILEQTGSLLKKRLSDFFASNKNVDRLTFKDIFRYSAKHGLMSLEQSEQWLKYRDKMNNTAHQYGEGFAEEILNILPEFIVSVQEVLKVFNKIKSEK